MIAKPGGFLCQHYAIFWHTGLFCRLIMIKV